MKLNKKHIANVIEMVAAAQTWHMIFWMQDDQDLKPGFRRREYQRRARWKRSAQYLDDLLSKLQGEKP